MSKKSRRPNREEIKAQRKKKKKVEAALRGQQRAEGFDPSGHATTPNRTSSYETVEEERNSRQSMVAEQIKISRAQLPVLLRRLKSIKDYRNPKKIKHKLTVVLIY